MRISDQMMYQNMAQNIDQAQAAYVRTSQEASSGVSISQPSDDPVGTALVLQMQAAQKQVVAWQSNAQTAQSQMTTTDQALSQMQTDLNAAESLATGASSGSATTSQLSDMSQQAQEILSDVASLFNTQYAGQYVFSGTQQEKPVSGPDSSGAYAVSGEQSGGQFTPQSLEIGGGVMIPTSTNATSVLSGQTFTFNAPGQDASAMPGWLQQRAEALGTVSDSSGSPQTTSAVTSSNPVTYGTSLVDVLSYLQQDLSSGNTAAVEADLGALQSQGETLSSLQATLGANMDRVQAALSQLQTTSSTLQTQEGSVEDVDMAQIIAQLTAQQTAYQSAVAAGAQMKLPTLASYLT